MKMSKKKLSLTLAVSILVLSPFGLLVRQPEVLADCPPFVPDALCPSNKPIPGQLERRFTICNKTSVGNVYVAIALNYTGSDGEGAWPHFESHGWWNIEPGACKKVYANSANRVRGYYVKSEDEDSVWSGSGSDKSYCINPSVEFEFKGSSTYSEGECQETGGQMVIFKPVRPNGQAYTLTLTD